MKITLSYYFFVIMAFIFTFSVLPSFAQTQETKSDTSKVVKNSSDELKNLLEEIIKKETGNIKSDGDLEIDGLIVDETKTKVGRDFYDFFYRDWVAPKDASNYSIFIIEKPFRLNTTIIEIKINEITVIESFLQPRGDFVETLAIESVANTQLYLLQYEQLVKDLGGEDVRGSGIY